MNATNILACEPLDKRSRAYRLANAAFEARVRAYVEAGVIRYGAVLKVRADLAAEVAMAAPLCAV